MRTYFTSGDVCDLTGATPKTLERWTSAGLLAPDNNRRGKGRHRLYRLCDVVAVAVGVRYKRAGADYERVAGVVKFLSGLGIERLEAEFDAGRTFPCPALCSVRLGCPA